MQQHYGGSWYWRWLAEQMAEQEKEEVVNATNSSVSEGVAASAVSDVVGDVVGQHGDVDADAPVSERVDHSKDEVSKAELEAVISVVGRAEEAGADEDEPTERPKRRRRKQVVDADEDGNPE